MLAINKSLVLIPPLDFPKSKVQNPFQTDNLIEKCPNGIADNHPNWVIDKTIGQKY